MIGKDVSVGYTVGWGCVSWLHDSCRQHSDPIAQTWRSGDCRGSVCCLYYGMRLYQLVTVGWGSVSRLYCKVRLCQLVTLWDEVVSVGYTVGWGWVSWLHSGMRLSVGYMMIAGSGSEGAAQWPYSTTKRSSGDCRRSAQLHHTAWHQHCMLVWRTLSFPPLSVSLSLHPFCLSLISPLLISLPLPPPLPPPISLLVSPFIIAPPPPPSLTFLSLSLFIPR